MGRYEAILKIAEYGNLTKAAQELKYAQSSLSYITGRIETELGIKIFHRERQGVTLTNAGRDLIGIMGQIEALETALQETAQLHKTSALRVASFVSISTNWLPGILELFYRKFPDTVVSIETLETFSGIYNAVQNRTVDCAFFAGDPPPGLTYLPLFEDRYFLVVRVHHPLSKLETVSLAQAAEYPFIIPSEEVCAGQIQESFQQFTQKSRLITKSREDFTTLAMLSQGNGFTILPDLVLRQLPLEHKDLCAIPLTEGLSRTIGMLCKPKDEASDVTKVFMQLAKSYVAEWQAVCPAS